MEDSTNKKYSSMDNDSQAADDGEIKFPKFVEAVFSNLNPNEEFVANTQQLNFVK